MQPRSGDGTGAPAATSQHGFPAAAARPDLAAPTSAPPRRASADMYAGLARTPRCGHNHH